VKTSVGFVFTRVAIVLMLICTAIFSTNVLAQQSQELSPSAKLRKLSLALRGVVPRPQEYVEIQNLKSAAVDGYLRQKAKQYSQDRNYVEKMHRRLLDLFQLKTSDAPKTMLDHLFIRVVVENRSWDELLLTKSYEFGGPSLSNNLGGGFLRYVFPEQIKEASIGALNTVSVFDGSLASDDEIKSQVEVKTPDQKAVVAGALTTDRFFQRYPTTKVNKNRKRAAAVFRIFLCDDLKPVILPSKGEDEELLNLGLGRQKPMKVTERAEKRHASDPACQSCHYKLDPLASTFQTSSNVLNRTPAPGALTFRRRDGGLTNVRVSGLGELAEAIVKQPEYVQCQVRHFWNWYMGADVALTDERLKELVYAFEKVQRKPNDFVQHLVAQREFYRQPVEGRFEITESHVRPILQRCNQCHESEGTIPAFDTVPIGFDQKDHLRWLKKIRNELDLINNGAQATMPPQEKSDWRLSSREIGLLQTWLATGAKDQSGKPSLSRAEIAELLPESLRKNLPRVEPGFTDGFFRYKSGVDLIASLKQLFPYASGHVGGCETLSSNNADRLGAKRPIDGMPVFSLVSAAYLGWVQDCGKSFVQFHLQKLNQGELDFSSDGFQPLSPELKSRLQKTSESDSVDQMFFVQWSKLDESTRRAFVAHWYLQIIGVGVLPREKEASRLEQLFKTIELRVESSKDQRPIYWHEVARWVALSSISSPEFLIY